VRVGGYDIGRIGRFAACGSLAMAPMMHRYFIALDRHIGAGSSTRIVAVKLAVDSVRSSLSLSLSLFLFLFYLYIRVIVHHSVCNCLNVYADYHTRPSVLRSFCGLL
jgi:hypothetical protein